MNKKSQVNISVNNIVNNQDKWSLPGLVFAYLAFSGTWQGPPWGLKDNLGNTIRYAEDHGE